MSVTLNLMSERLSELKGASRVVFSVTDRAVVAGRPYSPDVRLTLLAALLGGLFFALCMAYVSTDVPS